MKEDAHMRHCDSNGLPRASRPGVAVSGACSQVVQAARGEPRAERGRGRDGRVAIDHAAALVKRQVRLVGRDGERCVAEQHCGRARAAQHRSPSGFYIKNVSVRCHAVIADAEPRAAPALRSSRAAHAILALHHDKLRQHTIMGSEALSSQNQASRPGVATGEARLEDLALVRLVHALVDLVDDAERGARDLLQRE
jgi:hypothetical protein